MIFEGAAVIFYRHPLIGGKTMHGHFQIFIGVAIVAPAACAGDSCQNLAAMQLAHAKITLAAVVAGDFTPPSADQPIRDLPGFCRVAATLTPSADSDIKIEVWMPASGWNGKLQALGNGGWSGNINYGAAGTHPPPPTPATAGEEPNSR